MTTTQNPQQPASPGPAGEPFLSTHTAVVLLTAAMIGFVIGGLTVFTGAPVAAAIIAGITSAGVCIPVLRALIQ
ncbi:hypothetical protein [Streptomyces xantholiticus]|uniref:hypothetical protein n=1 Tax=Streptomyces xantholiticus TaxID=68285 RepID=UPI00167A8A16|nr:hypothetical protein [Streptomyces xantholiticus]GGW39597.1 hypothetical protein GCM10010381_25390 [Streptomyces xantholiticus]